MQTRDNHPLVSVIIPTFNRKAMLVECINSVLENTYKNIEVLVADDASSDGTERVVHRYVAKKKIIYFKNDKELLLSATINKAIKLSHGDLVFILDDDNTLDKKCIEELVSTFKKFDAVGVVGPLALYYSHRNIIMHAGTRRSRFVRGFTSPHANEKWQGQIKEGEEVEDFGNAFMFRMNAAKKAGLWDLLVPFYGEDADFQARVKKAGYKVIINPKAITYHNIQYLPKSNTMTLFFLRANKMRIYNVMRDKILWEFRYDKNIAKFTFLLSTPLYFGFYFLAAMESKSMPSEKIRMVWALIKAFIDGYKDVILKRSKIEYLNH